MLDQIRTAVLPTLAVALVLGACESTDPLTPPLSPRDGANEVVVATRGNNGFARPLPTEASGAEKRISAEVATFSIYGGADTRAGCGPESPDGCED